MKFLFIGIIFSVVLVKTPTVLASGAGASAGLTLNETVGARPASLGEAFSAVRDDIQALSYNPASLKTLEHGNAALLYEKGMVGDSYGSLMIGTPYQNSAVGLSIQYYNGIPLDLNDGVNPNHTVTSERDLALSLGWSHTLKENINIGVAAKYLSSDLAQEYSAHAFAADVGLGLLRGPLTFGLALQNFGSKLTYINEGDNLPRTGRLGMGWAINPHWLILGDGSYLLNEQSWSPGVGVEYTYSMLALRMGYRGGNDQKSISAGVGFSMGATRLDYAFAMIKDLSSEQRVSFSLGFGGTSPQTVALPGQAPSATNVKYDFAPPPKRQKLSNLPDTAATMATPHRESSQPVFYIVKEGDTYKSIAKRFYGSPALWTIIYNYNSAFKHNDGMLTVGDKIFIPRRAGE